MYARAQEYDNNAYCTELSLHCNPHSIQNWTKSGRSLHVCDIGDFNESFHLFLRIVFMCSYLHTCSFFGFFFFVLSIFVPVSSFVLLFPFYFSYLDSLVWRYSKKRRVSFFDFALWFVWRIITYMVCTLCVYIYVSINKLSFRFFFSFGTNTAFLFEYSLFSLPVKFILILSNRIFYTCLILFIWLYRKETGRLTLDWMLRWGLKNQDVLW